MLWQRQSALRVAVVRSVLATHKAPLRNELRPREASCQEALFVARWVRIRLQGRTESQIEGSAEHRFILFVYDPSCGSREPYQPDAHTPRADVRGVLGCGQPRIVFCRDHCDVSQEQREAFAFWEHRRNHNKFGL